MNNKYYAFEYWSGRQTTTGEPNKNTGYMSIAGTINIFNNKNDRDLWVLAGKSTCDMSGNDRESVTKKEARNLCLGMTITEYDEMMNFLGMVGEF